MPRPRAALFDMDRTLVRRETVGLYVRAQRHAGNATLRDVLRVSVWAAQYTLGILDVPEVAARALMALRGTPEVVMAARCDDWFRRYVEMHVADRGRAAVHAHRAAGDIVVIATGASPYAARPLARRLGIEHVVSSELEVGPDGLLTGRVREPLCYGEGKVTRTERLAAELGFRLEDAVFYTDSYTDLPLLERVGERVVVNPDPRLSRLARRRGWRVETW
jgi:HAD superfamily hydrolase (TIGR01490 family)